MGGRCKDFSWNLQRRDVVDFIFCTASKKKKQALSTCGEFDIYIIGHVKRKRYHWRLAATKTRDAHWEYYYVFYLRPYAYINTVVRAHMLARSVGFGEYNLHKSRDNNIVEPTRTQYQ